MTERKISHKEQHSQSVDESISPIYVPLQPEWEDTMTMQEPLMARGDFSNAWVMYDEDELPANVGRPTAMEGPDDGQPKPKS